MKVLKEPLDRAQAEKMIAKDPHGYIGGVVGVDLNEIIEADLEGFLNLISTRLTGSELLQDISYRVVGHQRDGTILIEVIGDPSAALEFMKEPPGPREWSPRDKKK